MTNLTSDNQKPENCPAAEHLVEGGIYSVRPSQSGRGNFILAKIVHLSPEAVHVVVFSPTFKTRPAAADLASPSVELALPSNLEEARARHLPLERKLFAIMCPVFIKEEPVLDADLAGFRRWSLMEDRQLLLAPINIVSPDNRGIYLRIFVLFGLPFGALQGIYHYFKHGLATSLILSVLGFVFFGGAMVLLQYLSVRRRQLKASVGAAAMPACDSASAFQVTELTVEKSFGDTFSLCQQAIRSLKNCRVLEEDFSGGTLEGKVGLSLTSEGEHVFVTTYKIEPGRTGVVVASVPRSGGEVDLGKNFDNVSLIVSHLKMACK
ncbi:MAG: hypothetical protein JSS83_27925 [Cyanobacteria bacterium SZAS LIN-3]|nr:hypothetical protein [Cyanobacteria bacterium SZAS LIN-3]